EPIDDKTFTGNEITPNDEVIVKDENGVVIPNTQYDISYEDNTNVGTAKVKITFKNNYDGVLNTTFEIVPKKHNDNHDNGQPSGPSNPGDFKASVEPIDDKTFTGNEITPNDEVIVKDENGNVIPDDQYDITYEDNTNVGTAKVKITFKNNYDGVINTTFEIVPKKHNDDHNNDEPSGPANPDDFKASVEPITDKSYTGNEITPTDEIVIKDESGNVIPSSEYDITFSDNIDAGVANVKITFKNNYSGVLNATFNIVPKAHDDKHNNKKDKGDDNPGDFKAKIDDIPAILYNGSPLTPKPVIRDGDKILVEGKDYKIVGYEKNNEVGTATVYVEFMGNYSGTSSVTFDIFAKTSPKTSDTAPIALSITLIISMIFSALAAFVLVSKKKINEV
ncbi:MAG: hypothetical protein MJ080_05165, partial [Clostridia bacterium]|nr:hypothetical protein [Clostridia bacterium]